MSEGQTQQPVAGKTALSAADDCLRANARWEDRLTLARIIQGAINEEVGAAATGSAEAPIARRTAFAAAHGCAALRLELARAIREARRYRAYARSIGAQNCAAVGFGKIAALVRLAKTPLAQKEVPPIDPKLGDVGSFGNVLADAKSLIANLSGFVHYEVRCRDIDNEGSVGVLLCQTLQLGELRISQRAPKVSLPGWNELWVKPVEEIHDSLFQRLGSELYNLGFRICKASFCGLSHGIRSLLRVFRVASLLLCLNCLHAIDVESGDNADARQNPNHAANYEREIVGTRWSFEGIEHWLGGFAGGIGIGFYLGVRLAWKSRKSPNVRISDERP